MRVVTQSPPRQERRLEWRDGSTDRAAEAEYGVKYAYSALRCDGRLRDGGLRREERLTRPTSTYFFGGGGAVFLNEARSASLAM